jgi:hypothetical protein
LARASAENEFRVAAARDRFDKINQPQKSNDTAKDGTMTSEKWEFASPGWLRALKSEIEQLLAAGNSRANWSLCEVFTGVPPHLDRDKTGIIAWHCRIKDGKAHFSETEVDDVDVKTIGDYQYLLPLAHLHIDPAALKEVAAIWEDGARRGLLRRVGDGSGRPAELAGLHNAVIAFTR